VVTREQILSRLAGLIGERDLAKALEPRRKRFDDERIVHETIRKRVGEAVRRLAGLGFVDALDDDHLRLRSPLLRFADPVRGLEPLDAALARLVAKGVIAEDDAALADAEGVASRSDGEDSDEDETLEEQKSDEGEEADT